MQPGPDPAKDLAQGPRVAGPPRDGAGGRLQLLSSRLADWLIARIAFDRWTIGQRLATLVLTLAIPLNLLVVTAIWQLAAGAAESQRTGLLYTARTVAAAVDAHLGKYVGLAQSLANSPALLGDDLGPFAAEAQRAFGTDPEAWLLVSDLQGQQLFNTGNRQAHPLPARHPLAFAAQQRAFERRSLIVSDDIFVGPVTQGWIATIEVPVFKDGKPYRSLAVAMKMQGFQRLLSGYQIPAGWLAGIIDAQGRFLARVPQNERYVGQLASQGWRNVKERDGVFEFLSLEGDEVVQGNAHPSLANWTVGIAAAKRTLQSAAWSTVQWATLLGAALSALSLLLALSIARRISGPIDRLRHNIPPLLEGSLVDFPAGSPEIAELANALQRGAAERKQGQEAAQRLAAIVHSSFDAIISKTLDGTVTSWNASAEAMFGYTAQEMIGQSIRRLIPADRQAEEDHILQRLAASQRIEPFETLRLRKDGRVIPVSITVSPMTDAIGRVIGASKIARDIGEQKAREQQVQLLLRELSHRSKNILAVVQAIAQRTAGSSPQFIEQFSHRLRALAVNQDVLAKGEWRGIDVETLVAAQLAPFADMVGARIHALGSPVRLSATAAQPIGMALHELATNASKYGALSSNAGQITVSWSVEDGSFRLSWSERGGPPVKAPDKQGFGTLVITTMVEQAVGGTVEIVYAPSGLSWRLVCPVAGAFEIGARTEGP